MGWMDPEPAELGFSSELSRSMREWRDQSSRCPRPDLLQAAQAGVLPPEAGKAVLAHLESCQLCKSLLADLEALDDARLDKAASKRIFARVQQAAAGPPAESRGIHIRGAWRHFWLRPLPVGIALLLVMGVIGIRLARHSPQAPTSSAVSHAAPSAQPSVFRLEKAPVVLPASAAIVWRGQDNHASKQAKDLERALAPYLKSDYAEAARQLNALRNKYPTLAEAPFYLGICQLFLHEDEAAAKSLGDAMALAPARLADEVAWYLALANERRGQVDAAISSLEPLCRAGGDHSERACAGVKELKARQ